MIYYLKPVKQRAGRKSARWTDPVEKDLSPKPNKIEARRKNILTTDEGSGRNCKTTELNGAHIFGVNGWTQPKVDDL